MLKKNLCALLIVCAGLLNHQALAIADSNQGARCLSQYAWVVVSEDKIDWREKYLPFKWTATAGKIVVTGGRNALPGLRLGLVPLSALALLGFVEVADVGATIALPFIKARDAYRKHIYAPTFHLMLHLQLFMEEIEGKVKFSDANSVATYLEKLANGGEFYSLPSLEAVQTWATTQGNIEQSLVFSKLVQSPEYQELKKLAHSFKGANDESIVRRMLVEYRSAERGAFCSLPKNDKLSGKLFRLKEVAKKL